MSVVVDLNAAPGNLHAMLGTLTAPLAYAPALNRVSYRGPNPDQAYAVGGMLRCTHISLSGVGQVLGRVTLYVSLTTDRNTLRRFFWGRSKAKNVIVRSSS